MTEFWWWIICSTLLMIGAGLILRLKAAGALATMLVLYVFLQVSSYFFWVPSYKDGGNGAAFADWFVWAIGAVVMTALASIPMLVAKLVNRTN